MFTWDLYIDEWNRGILRINDYTRCLELGQVIKGTNNKFFKVSDLKELANNNQLTLEPATNLEYLESRWEQKEMHV